MSHEARFQALELELPPAGKSIGCYKLVLVVDGLAYVSGHGPVGADVRLAFDPDRVTTLPQ